MTQEQIQNAAEAYAASIAQSDGRKRYCAEDFSAGAKWRINSVWHDATEAPQDGRMLLTDGQAGPLICGPNNHDWKETFKLFGVICWAYVDDLRPEE